MYHLYNITVLLLYIIQFLKFKKTLKGKIRLYIRTYAYIHASIFPCIIIITYLT